MSEVESENQDSFNVPCGSGNVNSSTLRQPFSENSELQARRKVNDHALFTCSLCCQNFVSKRKCIEHLKESYGVTGHIITCSCSVDILCDASDVKKHRHAAASNSIPNSSSSDTFNSNLVASLILQLQGVHNANEKTCLFVVEKVTGLLNVNGICTELLKDFSSERKIENKLSAAGVYIKPRQGFSELCGNYSYMPCKELFQFLVLHPDTSKWFLKPYKSDEFGGYEDFCHGARYEASSHALKEKMNMNFFHIILYADFVELANPLGSKAGSKGKVCIFQITFMNFPPWLRSKTKYLFFLACGSKDIALCNASKEIVLADFLSFLLDLENGFTLKLPSDKELVFYGALRVVVGDLQMLYDLHGLKLAFGSTGSSGCFACKTPNNEFNIVHDEKIHPFKKDTYFSDSVTQILLAQDRNTQDLLMKSLGVRERSLFDSIRGFSIVMDTLIDIMHVYFEGICAKVFHFVIQQFYHILKWVSSMQIICEAFVNFKYHPTIKKSDLPKAKNLKNSKTKCHSAMMMHMIVHLPLILSEFVKDEEEPVVKLYNIFVKIIQFSLSPVISETDLTHFEKSVKEFLEIAKSLMEPQVYLKIHLLNHLPRQIRNWGPLVRHWAMRFESKNSIPKQRISKNFKNIPLRTAKTYSYSMSAQFFDDNCCPVTSRESSIDSDANIAIIRGISYTCGSYINICERHLSKPIIAKILTIVTQNEEITLECQIFRHKYCRIQNAYELSSGGSKKSYVNPKELKNPFTLWDYTVNGKVVIIGKCLV
jgi:hypothetical protein